MKETLEPPPPEFATGRTLPEAEVRRWLGACGVGVKVYAGCRLIHAERIHLGDYSQIDEGVWIFAGEGVVIGRHAHLAFGSSISGGGSCRIGDFAGLGCGVRLISGTDLIDQDGLTNPTVPSERRTVRRGRIEIGAHAVIFTSAVVLPDVHIGEGAVVSAGAVVHHDLNAWGIYAGNPLVQVGVRASDEVRRKAAELLATEKADG